METKNDVYVISLDAVDLNFLPISQKHRDDGAVPLWSNTNLDSRRKEYYEFVIKTDETKEDQNEPVIENVTCHICDINVPKVYFNEHKNSFRHKFNRKVSDTALKRHLLYVSKEDINEFNEKLPSKHFCTECSIIINSEDETSHKQTTGHRNSLFLERFLNDFLNFYTNDDNEIRKYDERNDMKIEVMKESTNFEQDFISDDTNVKETLLANIKRESIKKDAKETKGAENYKTNSNSDELNNNLCSSTDLQDEDAFLEVFDGSKTNKFKVIEMCYDAIVVTSATSEYCMICNEMFVKENRLLHVDSTLHRQNLRQKSLDENCVRKIISSHYHCVLCNDYFTEYDLHVNSEEHLTNFRNKIMYKCKKTVQDDDNCNKDKKYDNSRKYSDVLKSDETKSSTSTNKNTAPVSKETKNSLMPSTSSIVAKNDTVENSDKTVKLDPTSYFCKVCQVQVTNNQFNIAEHNRGKSHMLKANKPIEEIAVNPADKVRKIDETAENSDKTVKLDPTLYFCKACQVQVPNNQFNIAEHNRSKSHMRKDNNNPVVERAVDPADKVREVDETAENCDKTVKHDPNSYFSNGGWSYILKENEKIELREARINSSINIHSKRFCDTCNKWISIKHFQRHINRTRHLLNAISDYRYLLIFLDKENSFCVICQETVLKVLKDITDHFTSSDHINKYKKLLKAQGIIKIDDEKYYCLECKVSVLHKNELLHIESKVHKDNLGVRETAEIDGQCDDITGSADGDATEAVALVNSNADGGGSGSATDNVEVDANNDTALDTVNNLDCNSVNAHPTNTLSDKLESIFIKYLSKIEPSNDGEIDSDDNDSEIDEKPKKKAKRDIKSHFCETCEVLVIDNPKSKTDHYKSGKHMRKLKMYHVVDGTLVKKITNLHYQMKPTAVLNVVKCIVCNVDLTYSDRNILTHIETESHKSNYKEFCTRNLLVLRLCMLFCTACGVKAGPGAEFQHCKGEKHKNNVELIALRERQ